jgi:GT2 family glycosyltransferase
VQLSVVIVCWNARETLAGCLNSIFSRTRATQFEVVLSDNGSTDGSVEFVRNTYPRVLVVENGKNLGCAGGRNSGVRFSSGEYVLLLDPDTIVHEGALDVLVKFADEHPEAAGFGCRILKFDGSPQLTSQEFPTIRREWMHALGLHKLGRLSRLAGVDNKVRRVDWHSGCCVMFRSNLLKSVGGFDEQFFYTYDEVDMCRRLRDRGYSVIETAAAEITHLGSKSVSQFPEYFELEKYRNRYRYFYKHFGRKVLRQCRLAVLTRIRVRQLGYGLRNLFAPSESLRARLATYRIAADWNAVLDPVLFVENGKEPSVSTAGWDAVLPASDLLRVKK